METSVELEDERKLACASSCTFRRGFSFPLSLRERVGVRVALLPGG